MELLKATNLAKSYRKKVVLKNLDITLNSGECIALIGANGAGKTTLCEILQGLKKPDQGEVHLFGQSLYKISKSKKSQLFYQVGVMMQETSLYKRFTIKEVIELFASFYDCQTDYHQLLAQLGMTEKLNIQLRKLSGGQKQKLYLVLALLHKPKLLFLDEPTTGVDIQSRQQIWGLINDLKKNNSTILLTTHYMEEAENLATRIVVLADNKVIANGSQKQLADQYINYSKIAIVAQKIEDVVKIKDTLERVDFITNIEVDDDKITAVINHSPWQSTMVSQFLLQIECEMHKLHVESGTLVDVYRNLTLDKNLDQA